MAPASQPDVQVALTFDFDGLAPWLQLTTTSPSNISRGEFAPEGLRRIVETLGDFGLPGTFFTPGHTALTYPDSMELLTAAGHEIGHHGWLHEGLSPLQEDEERSVIEKGLAALESVTGSATAGFRAPLWDMSPRTVDLLVEYEFSYDSSMMGKDFSPYWCRSGDVHAPDKPYVFGKPVDLVELPVGWHLDDFPYFEFVAGVPNLTGLRPLEDALTIWKAEFDHLYEQIGAGCMVVTMHPQSTGRGHRIQLLQKFIEHVLDHPGAEVVRAGDIAHRFRTESNAP